MVFFRKVLPSFKSLTLHIQCIFVKSDERQMLIYRCLRKTPDRKRGMKDSGKTTSFAPFSTASFSKVPTLSSVASRFRTTGAAGTAAALNSGHLSSFILYSFTTYSAPSPLWEQTDSSTYFFSASLSAVSRDAM